MKCNFNIALLCSYSETPYYALLRLDQALFKTRDHMANRILILRGYCRS